MNPGLPAGVFLGTSSWTFEGWKGLVYHHPYRSKAEFTRESLREYASHPLFRTVGIDASYYTPLTVEQGKNWAAQVPPDFRFLMKVWDELTLPTFPRHARYGARAGQLNTNFLDPHLFLDVVLGPAQQGLGEHLGPVVFEFAPMPRELRPHPSQFAQLVRELLSALPSGPLYCFELRNRELLTPTYLEILREFGAVHVQNVWSYMPLPSAQRRMGNLLTGPAIVSRMLIAPGERYEQRVEAWSPFDRIQEDNPTLRREAVDLIRQALDRSLPVYVIVNNKIEGCSPLTLEAIAGALCVTPADPM